MAEKKICSVLGDSISTFEGYTPMGFEFYDRYTRMQSGVHTVEDTWWMQVIHAIGGELGYNHSISGSTVSGSCSLSATAKHRQEALARGGRPDIIFIFSGSNDWACSVLPEEFEEAYMDMLSSLKKMYPDALICAATLLRGKDAPDPEMRFFNIDSLISPVIYSRIIRRCAQKAEAKLIDLESYHLEYDSIDGVHPDVNGMRTIAELWIREMKER